MFKEDFINEARELYPTWESLHKAIQNESGIIGRYLDDSAPDGISYQEVLAAKSLEELKEKAELIKRKNDLYKAYISGSCYQTEKDKRENVGCPRLYGQAADDYDVLDAFSCIGVFHIPDCPKFKTGECWEHFDKLGLKMV